MYYRYKGDKDWVRINSKKFFSNPNFTDGLRDKDIEIKHESTSPKQKEQQLKFIRNGKIHLAIANLKSVYHDKSIDFPSYQRSHIVQTIEILQQKLS